MGREPDTRRGEQDTNIGDQDAFMEQVMSWPPLFGVLARR
jgi:hypothetical protein